MTVTPLLNGVKIKGGTVWPMTKKVTRPKGIPETYLPKSAVLRLFDVSERTLKRDKKNGTIQTIKDDRGWNWFDPSSLTLRYAGRPQDDTGSEKSQTVSVTPVSPPSDTPQTLSQIAERNERIQVLEDQVAEFKISMQELRDDRAERKAREAKLLEIVEKQTLMLSAPEARPSFWHLMTISEGENRAYPRHRRRFIT